MSASDSARDARALFERLYAAHHTPILNYLYRLVGDPAQAEDMAQEAFTRAWKARAQLPGLDNPRAWLYRVATNVARDYARRARLLQWLPLVGDGEPALATAGPAEGSDPLQAEAVRRALLKLAPDYRVPLVLYTCQDFTVAEVAETLNLSRDAVKQRLVRARRQLREALDPPR